MNIIWIISYFFIILINTISVNRIIIYFCFIFRRKFNVLFKCKYIKIKNINIPFIFIKKLNYQEIPTYIIPVIELDSSKVIIIEE